MAIARLCSVSDCGKPHLAGGLCNAHYLRRRKYGSATAGGEMRHMMADACSIVGCGSSRSARGLCEKHYQRLRRHGDPSTILDVPSPARDWLVAHADHQEGGCLTWPFARMSNGYPVVRSDGQAAVASRVMCALVNGPPPSSIHEAAHSCGKGHEGCVNPVHLRWATPLENVGDQEIHGTIVWGEAAPNAKLSEEDVRLMRQLAPRYSVTDLGEAFGVSRQTAGDVIARRRWKRLA